VDFLRRFALAAASILVVACSGTPALTTRPSGPDGTPTHATTPGPPATVVVTSTPVPAPRLSSRLLSDEPVISGADLDPQDLGHYDFTLAAAYFESDDMEHAYTVGFGVDPGDQQPFHAVSSDGLEWAVGLDERLTDFAAEFRAPGPIPSTVMRAADGTWVMYLSALPTDLGYLQIYRATADAPEGPWALDDEVAVPAGEAGDPDNLGVEGPSVLATDDGFVMLYAANGGDRPHAMRILLARSDDGITWHKHGRVIDPTLCGGTDEDYVSIPRIFALDDGGFLALALMGNDVYGLRSADASNWTCQADAPLFSISLIDGSDRVHSYAALERDGEIKLLVEALFTSPDGDVTSNLWAAEVIET